MRRARNWLRVGQLALLLLLALAFEDALPRAALRGWRPAPVIYFSALAGLFYRPWQAALLGALAGLLQDLLAGRLLGLHLLSQALTAYGAAWLVNRLFRPGLNSAVCVVALATLVAEGLYGLLGYPFGLRYRFGLLPQLALLNMLFTPLVYLAIRRHIPADEAPPEPQATPAAARATQPWPNPALEQETAAELNPENPPEEEQTPC